MRRKIGVAILVIVVPLFLGWLVPATWPSISRRVLMGLWILLALIIIAGLIAVVRSGGSWEVDHADGTPPTARTLQVVARDARLRGDDILTAIAAHPTDGGIAADADDWLKDTRKALRDADSGGGFLAVLYFRNNETLMEEPDIERWYDMQDVVDVLNRRMVRLRELEQFGGQTRDEWLRRLLGLYIAHCCGILAEVHRIPSGLNEAEQYNAQARAGERFRRWYDRVRGFVDAELSGLSAVLTPRVAGSTEGYSNYSELETDFERKITELRSIKDDL